MLSRQSILVLFLLALSVPLAFGQLPLPGPLPPAPLVSVQGDSTRSVAPGTSINLSITARTSAGVPLSGATVVFVSPDAGASGLFAGRTFAVVTTNAGGTASATLVTNNTRGLFLVSAVVDNTNGAATFAIANGVSAPAAALSSSDARAQVRTRWLEDAQEGDAVQLHGPVLLPAGSQVLAAGPVPAYVRNEPVITDRPQWLFWIDDAPLAGFSHPVRWVLLDPADTSGQAAARARVIVQMWWPNVILPQETAVQSLAPPVVPLRTSSAVAIPADNELLRLLAPSGRPAEAPADACAIVIHGPNLGGAPQDVGTFRDFLQNNNLVPPGNILLNLPPVGGVPSAAPQPTSQADLQRLIDEAVKKGCKKLYFVLSTHGVDPFGSGGGGGIAMQPDPSNPGGFISYEKLMQMLAPLKGAELNVVLQSCYSGQIIPWLQGRGFTGQVITNADTTNVSWFYTTMGGELGFPLRAALKATEADGDKNGTVTFTEALNFVKNSAGVDPKALVSKPQSSAINPTGDRNANGGAWYLPNPGSYFMFLQRPLSVDPNQTLTVTLRSNDSNIADFDRNSITVVFPPGVTLLPIPLHGYEPGECTFGIETIDPSTGQQYRGLGLIQVGNFTLSPNPVRMLVGETKSATFKRFGPDIRLGQQVGPVPATSGWNTATTLQVRSLSPDIAVPTSATVPIAHGVDTTTISVRGIKEGFADIEVTDPRSGTKQTFTVYVSAPPPVNLVCPENATFNLNFIPFFDPSGHYIPIGLMDGTVIWVRVGNSFTLTGNKPQIVNISGTVDPATCRFSGSAFSPNPIAGFPNAKAEIMEGNIGPLTSLPATKSATREAAFDTITYQYRLGTNGVFPGGNPIYYNATGKLQGSSSCTYAVSPATQAVVSAGITGTVSVTSGAGCAWTATSPVPWITITTGGANSGNAIVTYRVDANVGAARSAALTIAGKTVTISQAAVPAGAPVISSVFNGASLQAGVAASAWVSIKGTNLSATTRIWTGADFRGINLPTQVEGVSVKFGGIPAYVYYVSPTQLNVLVPDETPLGKVTVQVTTAAGTSNPFQVTNEATTAALFQFDPSGHIYVASVHTDGSLVAKNGLFQGLATQAAKPLEDILLYGTGFGPTSPVTAAGVIPGAASPLAKSVAVRVGGQNAFVRFAGKVSPGLYQFNIVVPPLPDGDYEVILYVDGEPSARGAFLTVQR